ncbi:hypothetical protein RvY_10747 [Ramazzottius varieornatus]|uniref:CUB domain-containing protein n=1 Tax=Ramazzottius varieornatus TaxID=947166 RepID=A0A1D1VJ62_RAMVA|nr:hypothetical protein RvY_10747 [Ramazzottius varieornatus]
MAPPNLNKMAEFAILSSPFLLSEKQWRARDHTTTMWRRAIVLAAFVACVAAQCGPDGALRVEIPAGGIAYIESPNFGLGDYPTNTNCQWIVSSPHSVTMAIEIDSVTFSLESGGSTCGFDYVNIAQVEANGGEVQLGKFCGENGPQQLFASSTIVKVHFRSDNTDTRSGFRLSFKDAACANGFSLCPGSETVCILPSQYCNNVTDCPNGTEEGPLCSAPCGTTTIQPKEDRSGVVGDRGNGKSNRIVGGEEAIPHSLPWQVAFLSSTGSLICGGSIINPQWVMTAAHCCEAYAPLPRNYKVRAGAHVLDATNEIYAKTYNLLKVIVHPSYMRPNVKANDFCLLKIDGVIEFGEHVGAVCLADETDCPAGSAAMTSGWGNQTPWRSTVSSLEDFEEYVQHIDNMEAGLVAQEVDSKFDNPRNNALRQVYVDITTQEYCASRYPGIITPDMICAARSGKDSCQYDSGGPLVQKNAGGKWKLCGVVSFARGCAQPNYPGVYGRINYVKSWILQTIMSQ